MTTADFPYLEGAPISEAVIAVGFERAEDVDHTAIQSFTAEVSKKFNATSEPIITFEGSFSMVNGKPEIQQKPVTRGSKLGLDEGRYALQCFPNMLALSSFQSYEGGEKFISKFEQFWDDYCRYLHPHKIKRIGMRYINRFECTRAQYGQFFKITPGMNLGDMGIRTISSVHTVYSKKFDCSAIIQTQEVGTTDWADDTNLKIILDIDAFREIDTAVFTFAEVKASLTQIREMKNEIFFMNLTKEGASHFGAR